jgi:carbon starvation protein
MGDTRRMTANVFSSVLVVAGWGYFLIQGVRDPLGGINSLWPLFGIANQLLAAIALCLGTTIILKTMLRGRDGTPCHPLRPSSSGKDGTQCRPYLALVTLIPLMWLLSVTMTAGLQKIFHQDPRIGFLAAARKENEKVNTRALEIQNELNGDSTEQKLSAVVEEMGRLKAQRDRLVLNNCLDAFVAGTFLILVALIVIVSIREWLLLLLRRKEPELQESEPVWLPPGEITPIQPVGAFGAAALAFALLREISGQAAIERAASQPETTIVVRGRQNILLSDQPPPDRAAAAAYLAALEHRYSRISRCC